MVVSRHMRTILFTSLLMNIGLLLLYGYTKLSPKEICAVEKPTYRTIYINQQTGEMCPQPPPPKVIAVEEKVIKQKPYIFIGGVPSSGTTLTRVMLDAHPDIRCGEETRLVPRILQMRERWRRSSRERDRLAAAGLNDTVINTILRNFISNIIELHGPPAQYLCNKDPLALSQMTDLHMMFPNAKFLLIIRDGRAVAHSIVSRNITISGVDHKSYLSAAMFWNKVVERMWGQCMRVGPLRCLPVHFEDLVITPKEEMEKILKFLDIRWHDNVLHHSELINSEVSLSK